MQKDKSDDILFDIDMQLYDEFNDKFCEMNDNLGTIYTYKDLDDLEKAEKEKEIKLLREAIKNLQIILKKQSYTNKKLRRTLKTVRKERNKQQKEIKELKENNRKYIVQLTDEQYKKLVDVIKAEINKEWKEKINLKIEELNETKQYWNKEVIKILNDIKGEDK